MNTGLRRASDILIAVALLAAGLWFADLWLFHGWAASGPPSPRPEWHRAWSTRFFWAMCASFVSAALWILLRVRRWRSRPAR